MARWVFILMWMGAVGGWCAGEEKAEGDWVEMLLDPRVPPPRLYGVFMKIDEAGRKGRDMGVVVRLSERVNDRNDAVADRARWAIWCILGPDGYHRRLEKVKLRRLAVEKVAEGKPFELGGVEIGTEWEESGRFAREVAGLLDVRRMSLTAREAAEARWLAELEALATVWNPYWGPPSVYRDRQFPGLYELTEWVEKPEKQTELLKAMEVRLRSDVMGVPYHTAELSKKLSGASREQFVRRLVELILAGELPLDLAREAGVTRREASVAVLPALERGTVATCVRALRVIGLTGWEGKQVEGALMKTARSLDVEASRHAAGLLNSDEARALAQVSELLCDLRAMSKTQRIIAAKQLEALGLYPKQVTGALVKATEAGDLVVREGIVGALEEAFLSGKEVEVTLKELAGERGVRGVYGRAAVAAMKG